MKIFLLTSTVLLAIYTSVFAQLNSVTSNTIFGGSSTVSKATNTNYVNSSSTVVSADGFCDKKYASCAPILTFSTTTKKYIVPKEGKRIASSEANFSNFPKHLNFYVGGRKIMVVSRYWQTACIYDENGNLIAVDDKGKNKRYLCMQTATGKAEFPTELGLYNIQTKKGKDHKSGKYSVNGEIKPGELGAPMPYAMHFGRIIAKDETGALLYDYSDGSAMHEKQTINKFGSVAYISHGCIAIEKGKGKFLQNFLNFGDLILIVDNVFPGDLDEAISINK